MKETCLIFSNLDWLLTNNADVSEWRPTLEFLRRLRVVFYNKYRMEKVSKSDEDLDIEFFGVLIYLMRSRALNSKEILKGHVLYAFDALRNYRDPHFESAAKFKRATIDISGIGIREGIGLLEFRTKILTRAVTFVGPFLNFNVKISLP